MSDRLIREFTRKYVGKNDWVGALSFFGTIGAYFVILYVAIVTAWSWATPVLVILGAFAGVRLYVLQHDMGHYSLFSQRWMNEWAGHISQTFTMSPFRAMQWNHDEHHKHLGNLDERHTTEIYTMTVREWDEAGFWKRLQYRLYRNPLILLPAGGLFVYFIRYRWPKNTMEIGPVGVIVHDILLFAYFGLLYWAFGWTGPLVLVAMVMVAGIIGVFMVYLQHNFEETYWDRRPDLSPVRAALEGSSALDLGHWWDIGTGNIAYHDIHHFNARIPSYRLRKCHQDLRKEFDIPTIRWPEAIRSFTLKLWDEDANRLVPFPKVRETRSAAIPAE